MTLTGKARREYQRRYMREWRAKLKLNSASVRPKEDKPSVLPDELRRRYSEPISFSLPPDSPLFDDYPALLSEP